ncbi:hypothetical protein KIW84_010140 [Lathyrus oleraceus]|uniref:Uncharacterized protein n=1 Tax=Pisum sativum TaxID=3888 RepID=A0A9D4YJ23_PEA|nr:hypothetical protein KIW84_010140 [Pisum sativum]
MVETLIANQAAQAAQLQTAQAQVAEAQDARIQAQAQAVEMRNQMLTARLQAEEAQARAQVHNSGQTSAQNQPQIQNQTTAAPVTTVIASEINDVPVTYVTITASRPWEIPRDLNQDRYQQEFVPPNAPVFTNKLTRAGILTFKNMGPNVKDNPMPSHGPSSVNNIEVCLNEQRVTKIEEIRRSVVEIHSVLCAHGLFQHDHQICGTCSVNSRGCRKIQDDLQGILDQALIQISRQVSSPESQEQEEGSAMSPAEDEKEALISPSRSNTEVSIPQRVKKVDIQKLQGISCCSLSIQ